jgi:uncharacterized protein YbjT (DUF2867 family)
MAKNTDIDRPIVVVTGATEWQGGSVARELLEGGRFGVRVLARDVLSEGAAILRAGGAEVLDGDLGDLGRLREALAGCYAIYADVSSLEIDGGYPQACMNLLDAAADAGVGYFVMGAVPAPSASDGKTSASLEDIQSRIEVYARSLHLRLTTVTVAQYFERIHEVISVGVDSSEEVTLPPRGDDGRVPGIAAADVPRAIAALFERRGHQNAQHLHLAAEALTPWEYAVRMAPLVTGKIGSGPPPVTGYALRKGWDEPRAPETIAADANAQVSQTRLLLPTVDTFEQWLVRRVRSRFGIVLPTSGVTLRRAAPKLTMAG